MWRRSRRAARTDCTWKEIFNSDERKYAGTGNVFNPDPIVTLVDKEQDRYEINVHLPPLGAVILR